MIREDITHPDFYHYLDMKKIRQARKMGDKEEARELIAELRKKIRYQQERGIYLQEKFFRLLDNNPEVISGELLQAFGEDNLSEIETQVISRVINYLTMIRNEHIVPYWQDIQEKVQEQDGSRNFLLKVGRLLKQIMVGLGREAVEIRKKAESERIGMKIFRQATGKSPEGKVEAVRTAFSIQFTFFNKDDAYLFRANVGAEKERSPDQESKEIDSSKEVGGFFSYISPEVNKVVPITVLIANQEVVRSDAADHEKRHAFYSAMVGAFHGTSVLRNSWGNIQYVSGLLNRISSFSQKLENEVKPVADENMNQEFQAIIFDLSKQISAELKEELVITLETNPGDEDRSFEVLRDILTLPCYQYFESIWPESRFSSNPILLNEYKKTKQKFYDMVISNLVVLEEVWQNIPKGDGRKEKVLGFMRQNPLETWGKRARQYFREELARAS